MIIFNLFMSEDIEVHDPTKDSLYRNEEEMEESAAVVYFLTIGILIGLALREVNKKTKYLFIYHI